jgi:basic membrane lipoprotein Med (substrate-binding protein (PBP1-ABC) superfamily)
MWLIHLVMALFRQLKKQEYTHLVQSQIKILAPDTVLTSFVLDVEKAFDQAMKMVQAGNFSGEIFKPGLELSKGGSGDGIVYIAPFHNLANNVTDDVKHRIEQLKLQILEGTTTVPERYYQDNTTNSKSITDILN